MATAIASSLVAVICRLAFVNVDGIGVDVLELKFFKALQQVVPILVDRHRVVMLNALEAPEWVDQTAIWNPIANINVFLFCGRNRHALSCDSFRPFGRVTLFIHHREIGEVNFFFFSIDPLCNVL